MTDQVKKLDAGKSRLDLIPRRPLLDIAECLEVGATKYAPHAWRDNPMEWSRVFAAMLRHAFAAMEGEERDPMDGQLHLAAVAVNAMFLLEYRHTFPEGDNRHIAAAPAVSEEWPDVVDIAPHPDSWEATRHEAKPAPGPGCIDGPGCAEDGGCGACGVWS